MAQQLLITVNGGGALGKVVAGISIAWILWVSTTLATRFTREEAVVIEEDLKAHLAGGHIQMVERVGALADDVKEIKADVEWIRTHMQVTAP